MGHPMADILSDQVCEDWRIDSDRNLSCYSRIWFWVILLFPSLLLTNGNLFNNSITYPLRLNEQIQSMMSTFSAIILIFSHAVFNRLESLIGCTNIPEGSQFFSDGQFTWNYLHKDFCDVLSVRFEPIAIGHLVIQTAWRFSGVKMRISRAIGWIVKFSN
jgi:hypothetical protein